MKIWHYLFSQANQEDVSIWNRDKIIVILLSLLLVRIWKFWGRGIKEHHFSDGILIRGAGTRIPTLESPPPASASKSLLSWLKVRSQARSSCADGMSNATFGAIQKRGVLSNYVINYYIFISLYYNIYFFIYSIYIIKKYKK